MKFNRRLGQSGVITIDYMITFFLVMGFTVLVMAFSATLSVIEIVQYVSFSAARSFLAGEATVDAQKEAAQKKLTELLESRELGPLFKGSWFAIDEEKTIIDFNINQKYPEFRTYVDDSNRSRFHGVSMVLTANILNMSIPLFGSTRNKNDPSGTGGYTTRVQSFLGREPTFQECSEMWEQRWREILKKSGAASAIRNPAGYVPIMDNGC
jgi:hypothetical protein